MRNIKRITGIEGVRAGGRPRVKLPVNERVFGLYGFTYLDGVLVPVSQVLGRVRLFVNGITMWDAPAQYFVDRAKRESRALIDGELPLEFADPSRADKIDEQVTAWNLFGETSFELEFEILEDLGGKVPDVVFTRVVDGFYSAVNGVAVKQCTKITTLGKNCVAGDNDVDNLPTRDALQRISFYGVQPVELNVDLDSSRIIEGKMDLLERIYAAHGHTALASKTLRFDFTERIEDYLVVKKSLNLRIRTAAAGAMDMVVESLSPGFF